jgi:hypothetical protein
MGFGYRLCRSTLNSGALAFVRIKAQSFQIGVATPFSAAQNARRGMSRKSRRSRPTRLSLCACGEEWLFLALRFRGSRWLGVRFLGLFRSDYSNAESYRRAPQDCYRRY